jgi:L-threonylcarbamoyladenylate synthase
MAHRLDARLPSPATEAAIAEAAGQLAHGALVAFPTETVYGLGARADRPEAVAQIFAAKGRPSDHPLIVHLAEPGDVDLFAARVPPVAQRLIDAFWPGPLTLILPRRPEIGAAAAGGQDSIGLRCPSHPVAQALLRAARERGVPGVAAPSANRFGRVSPTCADHVADEFPELPTLCLLDGGDCEVGIESAIVDCSRGRPVLLRPGGLGADVIAQAAGEAVLPPDAAAPRASGTLASHYAPQARVRLMDAEALVQAMQARAASTPNGLDMPGVYSRGSALPAWAQQAPAHWRLMPAQAAAVAQELFAVLRAFDALGVDEIWVESPPAGVAWDGVRDRLTRAATR